MAAPRQPDLSRTDSVLNPTGIPEPVIVRDPDIEGEMQFMISPASLRRVVQELHLDKPRPGEPANPTSVADLIQSFRVLIGIEEPARPDQPSISGWLQRMLAPLGISFGTPEPASPPDPEQGR